MFRISSILSTVAVGLNMAEHIFIIAAANVYKPLSIIWRYGNLQLKDVRNYEAILSLVQAIGRNARRTDWEIENNSYTVRSVLVSKANAFENVVESLAQFSFNLYDSVEIVDLALFEKYLQNNKSKTNVELYLRLKDLKDFDKTLYSIIFPFGDFNNMIDIRFQLLKDILENLKNKDFDFKQLLIRYTTFLQRFKIIIVCVTLTITLHEAVLNLKKTYNKESMVLKEKEMRKKFKFNKSSIYRKFTVNLWEENMQQAFYRCVDPFGEKYEEVIFSESNFNKEFNEIADDKLFLHIFVKYFSDFIQDL